MWKNEVVLYPCVCGVLVEGLELHVVLDGVAAHQVQLPKVPNCSTTRYPAKCLPR